LVKALSPTCVHKSRLTPAYSSPTAAVAKKTGVLDQVYSALEGLDVREFGGIEPNPSYET
jgi:alcohol dehydrogenase YqhD (iron-dependent ADH family)